MEVPKPEPSREETDQRERFKSWHDMAYRAISNGISAEEQGNKAQALRAYQAGLSAIDKALAVPCPSGGPDGDRMMEQHEKMKRTKKEIMASMESIESSLQRAQIEERPPDAPPAYEEAMDEIMEDDIADSRSNIPAAADLLFRIPGEVQIFYVSSSGNVSAPSYPSALHIYKLRESEDDEAPAFIQVGSWTYPLLPGRSPALYSSNGAFMFPDLASADEGSAIGVILPATLGEDQLEEFKTVLGSLTALQQQPQGQVALSTRVATGIVKGAEVVSWGVSAGAEKTSQWIHQGAVHLKERMAPEATPKDVTPGMQKGLKVAKGVSAAAYTVSGYLVSQVGRATMSLGRYLAPHVERQGTKLMNRVCTGSTPQENERRMSSAMEVAAGAVAGWGTIYMGLEKAAINLAKGISESTVDVVDHKYGSEAAGATKEGLEAFGLAAMAGHNLTSLGPKGIAKRTAKNTGKAVLEKYTVSSNTAQDGRMMVEEEKRKYEESKSDSDGSPKPPPRKNRDVN